MAVWFARDTRLVCFPTYYRLFLQYYLDRPKQIG